MKNKLFLIFLVFNALSVYAQQYDTIQAYQNGSIFLVKNKFGDYGLMLKDHSLICQYSKIEYDSVHAVAYVWKNDKLGIYLTKEQYLSDIIYDSPPIPIKEMVYNEQQQLTQKIRYWYLTKGNEKFLIKTEKPAVLAFPKSLMGYPLFGHNWLTMNALSSDILCIHPKEKYRDSHTYTYWQPQTGNILTEHSAAMPRGMRNGIAWTVDSPLVIYNHTGKEIGRSNKDYKTWNFPNMYFNGKLKVRTANAWFWGMIDSTGADFIPTNFNALLWINKDYLWAFGKNGLVTVFNAQGTQVSTFTAVNFGQFQDGKMRYWSPPTGEIWLEDNSIADAQRYDNQLNTHAIACQTPEGWTLVNAAGKVLVEMKNAELVFFKYNRWCFRVASQFYWYDSYGRAVGDKIMATKIEPINANTFGVYYNEPHWALHDSTGKRYTDVYSGFIKGKHPSTDSFLIALNSSRKSVLFSIASGKETPLSSDIYPQELLLVHNGMFWIKDYWLGLILVNKKGEIAAKTSAQPRQQIAVSIGTDKDFPIQITWEEQAICAKNSDRIRTFNMAKEIIPASMDDGNSFYFWIKISEDWAMMDRLFRPICPHQYHEVGVLKWKTHSIKGHWAREYDSYDFLDPHTGQPLWSGTVHRLSLSGDFLLIENTKNEVFLINNKSQTVEQLGADFSEHWVCSQEGFFAAKEEGGAWGLANSKGDWQIPAIYDNLSIRVDDNNNLDAWAMKEGQMYRYYRGEMLPVSFRKSGDEIVPATSFINGWRVEEQTDNKAQMTIYKINHLSTKTKEEATSVLAFRDDLLLLRQGEIWRILGKNGWLSEPAASSQALIDQFKIIPNEAKLEKYDHYTSTGKGFLVYKNNAFGWIDAQNYKPTIPLVYNYLQQVRGDTFLAKTTLAIFQLIDINNNVLQVFNEDWEFWLLQDACFLGYYHKDNPQLKGIANLQGEAITAAIYNKIEAIFTPHHQTLFSVEWADSVALINTVGNLLLKQKKEAENLYDIYSLAKEQMAAKQANTGFSAYLENEIGTNWFDKIAPASYLKPIAPWSAAPDKDEALKLPFLIFNLNRTKHFSASGAPQK